MKLLRIRLIVFVYVNAILSMEAPPSAPRPVLNIIAHRTGTIDTSCITQATLVQNEKSLAEITYTLRGQIGQRELNCAVGPIAYLNEVFLGRITNMKLIEASSSSLGLLAFAIKDLKELHEKQDKVGIENHALFIDALVTPGSYESNIFEFFGFKKVADWAEQHVYLLDSTSIGQERTKLCQSFLSSIFMIALEDKSDQKEEIAAIEPKELIELREAAITQSSEYIKILLQQGEEFAKLSGEIESIRPTPAAAPSSISSDLQQLLQEQGKRTRGDAPKKTNPPHIKALNLQGINPADLPTPIPAAATAVPVYAAFPRLIRKVPAESSESSSEEMHVADTNYALPQREAKLIAIEKLRAQPGKPQKLSRTQLEAMQYKSRLQPIHGISKKTGENP